MRVPTVPAGERAQQSLHSVAVFSLQEGSQRISLCGSGYGNAAPLQVLL